MLVENVKDDNISAPEDTASKNKDQETEDQQQEFGGFKGLEPTRYGDWQIKGRVSDF